MRVSSIATTLLAAFAVNTAIACKCFIVNAPGLDARDIKEAGSASKNSALTKKACESRGGEFDAEKQDCPAHTIKGTFGKFLRACKTEGKELWDKEKKKRAASDEEDWEDIPGRIWADCGYDNGVNYSPVEED